MRKLQRNPFSSRAIGAIVLCALPILAAVFLHFDKKVHSESLRDSSTGYIDAQVCASCHAEIAATYQKTGMGRSFYEPTSQNVIEDYTGKNIFAHKRSELSYRMVERDGKFYQRRFTLDAEGREAQVLEEQVDYVLGSGNHARTYLHRTKQGRLVELPVSWYVERSGSWNMSPGFDRVDQPDMHGSIGPECMSCHNAYWKPSPSESDETIFPAEMPQGIDCQRCHGPGGAHVAAAIGGKASVQEIRSKIVNPARLARDRQMEVCLQCHLETSARHTPSAIRTYGREIDSFRPGESLGDYKTYFERPKDPKSDDFEVAHAGYGLMQSACFRKSQMTCITCHNPHDVPRGEEAKAHYVTLCEGCHTKVSHEGVAMTAGSDCLSCHMPKRRTEGSVHLVLTDHFIQRQRPTRDLTAPFEEQHLPEDKTPVQLFYPRSATLTERTKLLLAVARAGDVGIDGTEQLQTLLDRQHPRHPEPYVALGDAKVQAGKLEEGVRSFEAALKLSPEDPAALRALAAALLKEGHLDRAIEILQRAMARYPVDDGFWANLANAYFRQGKISEASEALSHAMALNPERADLYDLEGLCAVQRNDRTSAEKSFREAIRLQANLPAPQNNLANLLTGEQRYAEAEGYFRRAVNLNPGYADAHHGLGLLLILEHKNAEAVEELKAAIQANPKDTVAHTDLGDLFGAGGKLPEAEAEYRQALALNRAQPDANFGLGMVLLQRGQRNEAAHYLQQAAEGSDLEIRQTAQGVLLQLSR